jgi:uncharacterized protein YciI
MFLLMARYTQPADVVDQHLDAHRAWIMGHFEAGRILLTARQVPLVGGLVVARVGSRQEAEEMIRDDPFLTSGVAEYDILEFTPMRAAPGLEGLLDPA